MSDDKSGKREAIMEAVKYELDLPQLPESALLVQNIVDDENADARDLANVISSDPTLTSLLLRQANSPLYGFSNTINTVPLSIVVLGFDTVREIVLSVSIVSQAGEMLNPKLIKSERFWSHSLAVGIAARMLAGQWHTLLPGAAFVAGLIHDMGKLILAHYWPDEYRQAIGTSIEDDTPIFKAERQFLGTDHAEVASWLIERWKLPSLIVNGVSAHHRDNFEYDEKVERTVALANELAKKAGYRSEHLEPSLAMDEDLLETFKGFNEEKFIRDMNKSYKDAVGLLDLLQFSKKR
ncbi:HDOD domain-containing protein [bacterium]|nr:HDOD domain-containing protein [bacterium]